MAREYTKWAKKARRLRTGGKRKAWKMPRTREELHDWLWDALGLRVPRSALVEGSDAPFEYLVHAFFEGEGEEEAEKSSKFKVQSSNEEGRRSADCVVWACRGGGKTFLGAVATLLDLMFKEGIRVRILGGSLEQSGRMMEHLKGLLERAGLEGRVKRMTARRVEMGNGSVAEVAAASQTSVRGSRVHKIRCDEVDLFTREIWDAAQLTVTSGKVEGPWDGLVKGSVEALSTMQNPFGLMWELVGEGTGHREQGTGKKGRPVFRWGVVDVLERCGEEHKCETCPLFEECGGRAKARDAAGKAVGHVKIADAIAMKMRVGIAAWKSEMVCERPRREDAVFPEFDVKVHVYGGSDGGEGSDGVTKRHSDEVGGDAFSQSLRHSVTPSLLVCGMDFGLRSDAVVLLATVSGDNVLRIVDEYVAAEKTLDEHIDAIGAWRAAGRNIAWVGVDPAGRGREGQSGVSNITLLRKAGLTVKYRAMPREQGLAMVRARLAPAWAGQAGPRLFVHERCHGLIESMSRYHYPALNRGSVEPVKDGFDHACDALRYLVVNLDGAGAGQTQRYV